VKVQTFLGKINADGVHQLDGHVNEWLARNDVEVVHVSQCAGLERHHGEREDPVVILSVWYREKTG